MYTIFAGLLLSNIVMLILGLSGIRPFTKILAIPKTVLTPIIMVLCVVGAYSMNNSLFDVGVMVFFGILGYFLSKLKVLFSPAVLGLILGPLAERHFRTALLMSGGSSFTFVQSPIALFFVAMTIITLFWSFISKLKKQKNA